MRHERKDFPAVIGDLGAGPDRVGRASTSDEIGTLTGMSNTSAWKPSTTPSPSQMGILRFLR